jgi:hypothetical protein
MVDGVVTWWAPQLGYSGKSVDPLIMRNALVHNSAKTRCSCPVSGGTVAESPAAGGVSSQGKLYHPSFTALTVCPKLKP